MTFCYPDSVLLRLDAYCQEKAVRQSALSKSKASMMQTIQRLVHRDHTLPEAVIQEVKKNENTYFQSYVGMSGFEEVYQLILSASNKLKSQAAGKEVDALYHTLDLPKEVAEQKILQELQREYCSLNITDMEKINSSLNAINIVGVGYDKEGWHARPTYYDIQLIFSSPREPKTTAQNIAKELDKKSEEVMVLSSTSPKLSKAAQVLLNNPNCSILRISANKLRNLCNCAPKSIPGFTLRSLNSTVEAKMSVASSPAISPVRPSTSNSSSISDGPSKNYSSINSTTGHRVIYSATLYSTSSRKHNTTTPTGSKEQKKLGANKS